MKEFGTQTPEMAAKAEADRVERIRVLRCQISKKLDEISRLYKDDVRITLIVRVPDFPNGARDTVMSDDDPAQAIAALNKLYGDPASEIH